MESDAASQSSSTPLLVPIFALSSRLLAYVSPSPSSSSQSSPTVTSFTPMDRVKLGPITMSVPAAVNNVTHLTQADIGNAALKVGGGLLSGMKALGGLAVAAARGNSPDTRGPIGKPDNGNRPAGDRKSSFGSMFFSKSAPAATGKHEKRLSYGSSAVGDEARRETIRPSMSNDAGLISSSHRVSPSISSPQNAAAWITVVDLQPLLLSEARRTDVHGTPIGPRVVTRFMAFMNQPCTGLSFSQDGTCLAAVPKDGTIVRTFQIRPSPSVVTGVLVDENETGRRRPEDARQGRVGIGRRRRSSAGMIDMPGRLIRRLSTGASDQTGSNAASSPWHMYSLRRGRTTGIIEDLVWSEDARWVAFGTRKRTVHVFATNPYGGKPDEASHLEGRVKNIATMVTIIFAMPFQI